MIETRLILTIAAFVFLGSIIGSMTSYAQSWDNKLSSVTDPNFEIVGSIKLGLHKESRTKRDVLGVVVIYAPDKYLKQSCVSDFLLKIKPKFSNTESYFAYFLNDRELAEQFFNELKNDKEEEDLKLMKSTKAVFVLYRGERKTEILRIFENGMKEKDFELLENNLEN